ncbi:MAG: HNH endonuclease [Corynebacterium sp.]|nr:HNH endonuclease [Corynebacterium sp.]
MKTRYQQIDLQLQEFVVDLWHAHKSHSKQSVDSVVHDLGCSRGDAEGMLLAGELFAHKASGPVLKEAGLPVWDVAKLGAVMQGLKNCHNRFTDLANFIRESLANALETTVEGIITFINRKVRDRNAKARQAEKEKQEAERQARREAIQNQDRQRMEQELAKSESFAPPQLNEQEVRERTALPNFRAQLGTLFLDFIIREDQDNMIVISGLTNLETLLIRNKVRSRINELPPEILRLPEREMLGHAARLALFSPTEDAPHITTTVVSFAEDLHKDGEFTFRTENGMELNPLELLSAIGDVGSSPTHIVVNEQGRVISESNARLAPAAYRRWHQVEADTCLCCNRPLRLTEHHMVPWEHCQSTEYGNMIPLCVACHPAVEANPQNLAIYYDLGFSVFKRADGRITTSLLSKPFAAISRAIARKHGLREDDWVHYSALRQGLRRMALDRYAKEHP